MDPKLQQALATYMEQLLATVKAGADFAGEQIPLIVQEKLTFDFWLAIANIGLGLIFLIGAPYAAVRLWRVFNDPDNYEGHVIMRIVSATAAAIISVSGLVMVFEAVPVALKIWLAPRLYIIEWATSMVTGTK